MFYFEKNGQKIDKYMINFERDKLLEIREDIINKFSTIIKVRNNYNYTKVRSIEDDFIKNYSYDCFKINFDYYIYPKIIKLIDELLNGNVNIIVDLINFKQKDIAKESLFTCDHIKEISKDINNKLQIEITEYEINDYIKNIEVNNDKYSNYIKRIFMLVKVQKVESIDVNKIQEIAVFLNLDNKIFNNIIDKPKIKINSIKNWL